MTDDETEDGKAADAGDVPLGRPLHGVTVASPSGAATEEIVVGGGGLSYGYLGDPRATAAAFVPAPGGLRWYRTGDLGVLDSAGRLRFRGRADRQLKIRGQRLEPEEVEHLLRRTLPVAAAAVTPRRDALGAVTGVLGHVVPLATDAETTGWADRIRTARSPIPPEFRPSRLIVHPRLPVLATGKVDYATLEAAGQAVPTPVSTPPPSPELDHVLAAAHEVGLAVAPDTDLFAAGLDSLTVVRLLARLHRHRPRTLTPADVYRHSTPAALAEAWAARAAAAPGQHRDLPRAVSEMWLHEQMEPGDHAALVACAFRVGPRFERLRWENAVRTVARRHVALGTLLDLDGDRLRRMSAGEAAYDRLAAGRPWPATGDEVLQLPRGSLAPFDLAVELPWRWYLDTRTATVLLVFHHVAIDGWSEPLVLDDLGRAYRGESFAATPFPEPADPAPPTSGFWERTLAGAVRPTVPAPAPALPGTAASALPAPRLRIHGTDLDRSTGGRSGPARHHALLGALADALRTLSETEPTGPLVIGVAYAGRDDTSTDYVGLLVRVLPVVLGNGTDPATAWLDALTHADELALAEVSVRLGRAGRDGSRPFSVVFVLHSREAAGLDLGWGAPRVPVRLARPPFAVVVEGWPASGGDVDVIVDYDVDLVDRAWAQRLAAELPEALRRTGARGAGPR